MSSTYSISQIGRRKYWPSSGEADHLALLLGVHGVHDVLEEEGAAWLPPVGGHGGEVGLSCVLLLVAFYFLVAFYQYRYAGTGTTEVF